MKKFWLKIFVLVVLVGVLFELTFGVLMPKLLFAAGDTYIDRWKSFYSKPVNADIVILGTSRVHRHFNPDVIATETKLKTEIIAIGGAMFNFDKLLYADYLKINKPPKVLILGLDLTGIDSLFYVPSPEFFYPAIPPTSALRNIPEYSYIKYHKAFGYFFYKDLYFDIIENPEKQPHVNGFLSRDIPWSDELEAFVNTNPDGFDFKVSTSLLDSMMHYISTINKKGITCFAVISPEYHEIWKFENNRKEALETVYTYAKKYDVKIINFSDSTYKVNFNKNLFYNSQHLNAQGAKVFSKDVADTINSTDY